MIVNAVSHRISRVVSGVFALTLLGAQCARADIAPDPVTYVVMPSLFWAFIIFIVAVFARFLLLLVRSAVRSAKRQTNDEQPAADPAGDKWYFSGKLEKRAAILALIIGVPVFYYWGYEQAWEKRRIRIACSSSRVKSNLGAIRSTEVAYCAEWSVWVGNQPLTPVADRRGNKELVEWNTATRFSILGFAPEGKICCSYTLEGPDYPTQSQGFTARAECDFDKDGNVSVWTITNTSTDIVRSGAPF
jgi:hypothetical protein